VTDDFVIFFTFKHDEMGNVVASVDHWPVDEIFAVLDEDFFQELGIGRVNHRRWTTIPTQNLTALSQRFCNLKIKPK